MMPHSQDFKCHCDKPAGQHQHADMSTKQDPTWSGCHTGGTTKKRRSRQTPKPNQKSNQTPEGQLCQLQEPEKVSWVWQVTRYK